MAVTAGSPAAESHTTCTNILGIDYSGTGIYNPSLLPALGVAVAAGAGGALATRFLLRHRRVATASS